MDFLHRAQDQGEPWITAAMGMAMPILKKIAGNAAHGFHGDIADFDSEIVEAFLYALNTVDPRAPNLFTSLRFMAQRYATEAHASEDRILGRSTEFDEAHAARKRGSSRGRTWTARSGVGLAKARGVSPYLLRQQLVRAQDRLIPPLPLRGGSPAIRLAQEAVERVVGAALGALVGIRTTEIAVPPPVTGRVFDRSNSWGGIGKRIFIVLYLGIGGSERPNVWGW
jgi:hypothetical protein